MALTTEMQFPGANYYRALFENPKKNSVLLISANGIILETNRAFLLSFGYEKEDVIGQNFSMLFSDSDQKKDLPAREINTVLDEGQSFDNNYLVNKNKTLTWVSGESVLLDNGPGNKYILKIIQNIHAQKESEYSIIRLNNFNENILGAIEDAVIVVDKELKILKANRSFTQIFNFPDDKIRDIDFRAFIKTFDLKSELLNLITHTLESRLNISKIQQDIDTRGSDTRTFDISCSMLDEEGEQSRILLIFHDVTDQKRFEKQREDILNFVAHEFRNPLTNVILNLQLLDEMAKERNLTELGTFIERARNNGQRLKKLINGLYKTTKLISGSIEPECTFFDFEEMIDEAIQSTSQVYFDRNIEKKGNANITLFADRDKLIQVVTNYLTNAIKYSDGNKDIEVELILQDDTVITVVKDKGKGIPSRDLPYIFNRFFRADKTKGVEGLGLGLFLSRQIVAAHEGHTWVESEEGKGSSFYFSLPVKQLDETSEPGE